MPPRDFPVEDDEDGSRLETFLRKHLGLSRPTALKALRKGWVRVDGKRAKGSRHVVKGETIRITNYALPIPLLDGSPDPVIPVPPGAVERARGSVLHRDDDLIVSNKPSGTVVHAGSGHDWGWIDALRLAFELDHVPTPIGRLDRDTSGLLALACGRGPARELFAQLDDGRLARRYLALVSGGPSAGQGRIERGLAKRGVPGHEQMRADESGPPAATRFSVVERLNGATLLQLDLETGRTHQIRAHLAAEGWPILGDPRYGDATSHALSQQAGVQRLALHAGTICMVHPRSGEELSFSQPWELQALLERLR